MSIIQALILSLVEGITEFLPISSTGHLILASNILKISPTEFVKTFEIAIQLGAIMAVVWIYWKEILTDFKLWGKISAAFLPTAILGFIFYKPIKIYLLGNTNIVLWSLFIGGIILLIFEKLFRAKQKNIDSLSWQKAAGIGLIQAFSMIPGVSRAAATIIGGMFMGLSREKATKFSFILAIPTMAAATGLDLIKSKINFSPDQLLILGIGFAGAFVTAFLTVKFLIKYVQKHDFKIFGVYRILLALTLAWWLRPQ